MPVCHVPQAVDTAGGGADHTGLSKGGQQIAKARTVFSKAVDVLVQLATLQTSFVILDEVNPPSSQSSYPTLVGLIGYI